jgi:hypothetical protein
MVSETLAMSGDIGPAPMGVKSDHGFDGFDGFAVQMA